MPKITYCKKHQLYRAARKPRAKCETCIKMWQSKERERKVVDKIFQSERMKRIRSFLEDTIGMSEPFTMEDVRKFGLEHDDGKKYYMYCFWEGDHNGSTCDTMDIIGSMEDIIRSGDDGGYRFNLFDIEENLEVEASIVEIRIAPLKTME